MYMCMCISVYGTLLTSNEQNDFMKFIINIVSLESGPYKNIYTLTS